MTRIDPISLQLFLATVREGSIKRAADVEHIAQSALSRRIADLEHSLGVPLLIRSPKGVELTEAGQRAHALGQKLNDDIEAFAREVREFSGVIGGTVRLSANPSSIVGFLPERLQPFLAAHPDVVVALKERHTHETIRACSDNLADIGIGVASSLPHGVESWHFAHDPLIVILPPQHPLVRQRSATYAEVLQYSMVAIQSGGALDGFLHEKAETVAMPYKQSVAVTSFEAACRMVEAGLGIAVMTASAVSAFAGTRRFVRRPLNETWRSRELRVYAPKKSARLSAVEALLQALKREPPPMIDISDRDNPCAALALQDSLNLA